MRIHSLLLTLLLTALAGKASTFVEKFSADPTLDGWQTFGDTNLFQWNSTNQNLAVTWDSTQPNSYFYLPLGRTLTTNDGFCIEFDLNLTDATAFGYGSELAVGLLHWADATNVNFSRANVTSPNVFEFAYFPPDTYGDPASLDGTLIDTATNFYFAYDNPTLNNGVTYHILLLHQPHTSAISGEVFANGQIVSTLPVIYSSYPTNDTGAFVLDTLSISSYADDGYGDSILAHGTVDNLVFASPLPVGVVQTIAAGKIQFASDTNWIYTLQQTADFQSWSIAAPTAQGNGTNLVLQATNPPVNKAFYRVSADLP